MPQNMVDFLMEVSYTSAIHSAGKGEIMSQGLQPLTQPELDTLKRALDVMLDDWAQEDTKAEALQQISSFGPERFYQLAISNYLAFFQHSPLFETTWNNFHFRFTFGSLLKVTQEDADLLVLGTSDTYDFVDLPQRAMNRRIAQLEGIEYIHSFRPEKKLLKPNDLIFIPSRERSGLTYCFVPVFKQVAQFSVAVSPEDVETGVRAVLDYLLSLKSAHEHQYNRVIFQPIGLGKFELTHRDIIRALWQQLRSAGKSRQTRSRDKLMEIELRVFSPRAVATFLELFVEDQEALYRMMDQTTPQYTRGQPKRNQRGIVCTSPQTQSLFEKAERLAKLDSTVLLLGERGTGKDVVANYIHDASQRGQEPFWPVNCSAIPENIFESEMFGHMVGSFSGAERTRVGYVELAGKGTLFLDEVGDLSPSVQAKLLTVLEQGTFIPVGGEQQKKMKARVIAATNKDLESECEKGRFREDLYDRLAAITLTVPPLRDRIEDLPELMDLFNHSLSEKNHILPPKKWDPQIVLLLMGYSWPGNIREVQGLIRSVIVFVDGPKISLDHVLEHAPRRIAEFLKSRSEREQRSLKELSLAEFWYEYERVYKGNGKEMAKAYGVTESLITHYKKKHEKFKSH
jgi:DNA-binding NtrC family response regulator